MRTTGTATINGAGETFSVFSLALGTEQIEQECGDAFALSGWEWTACTVPMANTRNTQSTATVLAMTLRFAQIRSNDSPCRVCNDSKLRWTF